MECAKEEAIKARAFADKKMREKDFFSAKEFVLKAKALFPELEGIPQMLTTLEVFIALDKKINGEIDWYEVLGVTPSAGEDIIRKQYRKLALILHPDKNKSTGAEGAFKAISEAWSLLSDKPKRLAYNQRRSSKRTQHVLTKKAKGFDNVSQRATSSPKVVKNSTLVQPRTNTFWTKCHKCKMHYEYLRVYLNNNLLCPNCRKPFHALETPPPAIFSKKTNMLSTHQRKRTLSHCALNGLKNNENLSKPNISLTQQKNQNPKHGIPSGTNNTKKRKSDHKVALCNESVFKRRRVNDYGNNKPKGIPNFMQLDIGRLKVEKACTEVREKLVEWHLEAVTKAAEAIKKKENQKRNKKETKRSYGKGKRSEVHGNGVSSSSATVADTQKELKEIKEPLVMNVPDPDFYKLDPAATPLEFLQISKKDSDKEKKTMLKYSRRQRHLQ